MPYTCAFTGYVCVAAVASRGCSRGWRARAAGHKGATAGRPGERAAAASGLAPSACARAWRRSAALAVAAVAHCVSSLARQHKAQKPRGSENRPIAGRRFHALWLQSV